MFLLTRLFLTFVFSLFLSSQVAAQAEVRQASSGVSTTASVPSAELSAIYEIQSLQEEVQTLRGMLEEQAHEIKRLKQQRLDDYLDLDKRVSEITKQQQALANTSTNTQVVNATPVPTASVIGSGTQAVIGNNSDTADALYNEGINLLLNAQDYAGAEAKFTEYLDRFKGGQYTPNAYYWKGQILFADGEKQAAADHFELLVAEYPTHAKVPDAQFKLARIYFDQGKKAEAKEILDNVASSNSDAALLAKSFISKNY